MKTIIYNDNNLNDNEINRVSKRAKAIIKNSNNQILLACSNNNYHLPGGHLENDESDYECLVRELKEEVGVDVHFEKTEPIISIIYYNKDYPSLDVNSKSIANYYELNVNVEPNLSKIHLTEDEKKGNFNLQYIDENNILKFLEESMKKCTKESVVADTIEALKEYLNRRI